jgi:circadian clock protein KaiB
VTPILLQLFIAGRTPRTDQAIATLRQLVEHQLNGYQCQLVIVDVLTDPQQAEDRRILATPTLIKESPLPQRRIIGDLADAEGLLAALSLPPPPALKPEAGGDEGVGGHWLDDHLARV